MPTSARHAVLEQRFRELLATADLPAPEEVARLERAIVFVWYEPRALVVVDLDGMPDPEDLPDLVDLDRLESELLGNPELLADPLAPPFQDFAEAG